MVIAPPAAPPPGHPFHRFVGAAATGSVGAIDSDDTFGHFGPPPDGVVAVVGAGFDHSALAAGASQDSIAPDAIGPVISGVGRATASVSGSTSGSYSVTADSFFDVFFVVDMTEMYQLSGFVDAGGITPPGGFPPGSGGTFSYVTLENFSSSTVLYSEGASTPADLGPDPLGFSTMLVTGTVYHLTAEARVDRGGAPGSYSDFAAWDFRLDAQVPEPSSVVLMAGLGLLLPAIARRRMFPISGR